MANASPTETIFFKKALALFWRVAISFLLLFALSFPAPAMAEVDRYLIGEAADINLLGGPVFDLGGGGPDVDAAMQWMVNQVMTPLT